MKKCNMLAVTLFAFGMFAPFAFGEEIPDTDEAAIAALGKDMTSPKDKRPEGEKAFALLPTFLHDGTETYENAFNNVMTPKEAGGAFSDRVMSNGGMPLILGYTFATPKKVVAYSVTIGQLQYSRLARAPKTFTLYGTNDDPVSENAHWTNLGTGTSGINKDEEEKSDWAGSGESETRYYRCQADASAYTSFKWVATSSVSDITFLHVTELELFAGVNENDLPALAISADVPDSVKDANPDAFADKATLAAGEVSVQVPAEFYMSEDETSRRRRVGYELTAYNAVSSVYDTPVASALSSDGKTLTFGYDAGNHYRLIWNYELEYRVTCSAADGLGTVEPALQWVKDGELATIKATPNDAGYVFLQWRNDAGATYATPEATIPVTGALHLTAVFWQKNVPFVWHVKTSGDDAHDGLSPDAAKASIPAALAAIPDGIKATILVHPGTHELTAECVLEKDVTIHGETGRPEDVIVQRGEASHNLFRLMHTGATLSSLTIQNGVGARYAAGNVTIPSNSAGGTVTNCILQGGFLGTGLFDTMGSAIRVSAPATVTHCIIRGNTVNGRTDSRGAVCITSPSAVVRNCLIVGNTQHSEIDASKLDNYTFCGGVYIEDGRLENCTIADNFAQRCAGVWANGGVVVNCLIDGNLVTDETWTDAGKKAQYAVWAGTASCFTNCAAPMVINSAQGSGCLALTKDPFKNRKDGNYQLTADAEVVDEGCLLDWMAGATDLAGNPRVQGRKPDIGCYERAAAGMRIVIR